MVDLPEVDVPAEAAVVARLVVPGCLTGDASLDGGRYLFRVAVELAYGSVRYLQPAAVDPWTPLPVSIKRSGRCRSSSSWASRRSSPIVRGRSGR